MQTLKKKNGKTNRTNPKKNCLDSLEWESRRESLNMFCVFGIFFVVFDFVAGKNTVYFEKGKPCTFYFCDIFLSS
jgi:hypothetical protein